MPTRRLTIVLLVVVITLGSTSFAAGSWSRSDRFAGSARSARSAQDGATPDLLGRVHASQTAAATATVLAREQAARDATATAVTEGQVLTETLDRLSPELIDDLLLSDILDYSYLPDPFDYEFDGEVYWSIGTDDFWRELAPELAGATSGLVYGFGSGVPRLPYRDYYRFNWQVYLTIDQFPTADEALAAMEGWGQFEVDAVADADGLPALVGTRTSGEPGDYVRERVDVARFQAGPLVVSGVISRTIEDGIPLGTLYQPENEVATGFAQAGIDFLTDLFVGAVETSPMAAEGTPSPETPAGATPIFIGGTPSAATPITVAGTPAPGAATPLPNLVTWAIAPTPADRAATNAAAIESTATSRSATATQSAIDYATTSALSTQSAATQDALSTRSAATQVALATQAATTRALQSTQAAATRVVRTVAASTAIAQAQVTSTAIRQTQVAATRVAYTYQTATSVVSTRAASTAAAAGVSTQAAMASQTRTAGTQSASTSTATATSGPANGSSAGEVILVINDGQFVPEASSIVRGQTLVLINAGSEPCNFVVVGFNNHNPVRVPVDRTVEWVPPPAVGVGTHPLGCVSGSSPIADGASITIVEP